MIPRMRSSPLVAAASAMKLAISMWSGETSCSVPESLSLRSEEHTSELQSPCNLVCRLLLEKKKNQDFVPTLASFHIVALNPFHVKHGQRRDTRAFTGRSQRQHHHGTVHHALGRAFSCDHV